MNGNSGMISMAQCIHCGHMFETLQIQVHMRDELLKINRRERAHKLLEKWKAEKAAKAEKKDKV